MLGMIQFGGETSFGAQRASHVAAAIQKGGYEIFASDVGWHRGGIGAVCGAMLDARVEGVVLVAPAEWFPESELQQFRKAQIPVVALSGVRRDGVPQVAADNRQGMYDLTQHLLQRGFRRFALVTTWPSQTHREADCWPVLDRVAGFREAIEQAGGKVCDGPRRSFPTDESGIEAEVICSEFSDYWTDPYRLGQDAMGKLLQRARRPQAVVCSNDDWALGALAACAESDVRVPQDIAVTGFDNTRVGGYGAVPLTTVGQPLEKMATTAVEILVKLIRGQKLTASEKLVKLPCQLVVRRSCGAHLQKGSPMKPTGSKS